MEEPETFRCFNDIKRLLDQSHYFNKLEGQKTFCYVA